MINCQVSQGNFEKGKEVFLVPSENPGKSLLKTKEILQIMAESEEKAI